MRDHPFEINIDDGTICDGDADDNFFLHTFRDVQVYTEKKYGVWLEWRYTEGRARHILEYIKGALAYAESIELWHVWLMDYYEYEDSPVIHERRLSINELRPEDIRQIDNAEIWNKPDRTYPGRPSFYRLTITR